MAMGKGTIIVVQEGGETQRRLFYIVESQKRRNEGHAQLNTSVFILVHVLG